MNALKPGDRFHVLEPVSVYVNEHTAVIADRGATVVVTAEMLAAHKDRNGHSALDLVGDRDAQRAQWGRVRYGVGAWPENLEPWRAVGDTTWTAMREQARAEADSIANDHERAVALRAVSARFGNEPTQKTVWQSPDEKDRRAQLIREGRAER